MFIFTESKLTLINSNLVESFRIKTCVRKGDNTEVYEMLAIYPDGSDLMIRRFNLLADAENYFTGLMLDLNGGVNCFANHFAN